MENLAPYLDKALEILKWALIGYGVYFSVVIVITLAVFYKVWRSFQEFDRKETGRHAALRRLK